MNQEVDIELLINLVRLKEYLYDKGHKYYKDAVRKENAWEEIAETLNSTSEICEKIWKSLKDKYTRERKKYQPSGSCPSETPWPWYIDLNFLDEFIQQRKRNISTRNNDVSSMYKTFGDKLIVEQEGHYADGHYADSAHIADKCIMDITPTMPISPTVRIKFNRDTTPTAPTSPTNAQGTQRRMGPHRRRTLRRQRPHRRQVYKGHNADNAHIADGHYTDSVHIVDSCIRDTSPNFFLWTQRRLCQNRRLIEV
ncbi:hypothetical protein FQR65_LT18807 [Abscondita terminalis]|nr:hypothetical protein FQR65_LT18807 [Abscondita terminalis]